MLYNVTNSFTYMTLLYWYLILGIPALYISMESYLRSADFEKEKYPITSMLISIVLMYFLWVVVLVAWAGLLLRRSKTISKIAVHIHLAKWYPFILFSSDKQWGRLKTPKQWQWLCFTISWEKLY